MKHNSELSRHLFEVRLDVVTEFAVVLRHDTVAHRTLPKVVTFSVVVLYSLVTGENRLGSHHDTLIICNSLI